MIALFVLPHATESVSEKKVSLLSHKMAIPAQKKSVPRRDFSLSNKRAVWKLYIQIVKWKEKQ